MKTLNEIEMCRVTGGNTATVIIGGVACTVSFLWPIGTLIAGTTCAGMIIATVVD